MIEGIEGVEEEEQEEAEEDMTEAIEVIEAKEAREVNVGAEAEVVENRTDRDVKETVRVEIVEEEAIESKAVKRKSMLIKSQAKPPPTNKTSKKLYSYKNKVNAYVNSGHYSKTEAEKVGLGLANFRNKPKTESKP